MKIGNYELRPVKLRIMRSALDPVAHGRKTIIDGLNKARTAFASGENTKWVKTQDGQHHVTILYLYNLSTLRIISCYQPKIQ